ncbi:hypothetical protein ACTA71_010343 [Dictyostelium dimigraforme]
MYQVKLENQKQETIMSKTEDKTKEELITTVYDLKYCITNLEEQNPRITSEASIFKEKSEDNEKKVNEAIIALLAEIIVKEEYVDLAQVTEQFINDGPEAAMMNAEWIFSKSNEFDLVSRLHYLVNNVFRRTGETRV